MDGPLHDLLLAALRNYGATAADELVQAVARQLGFKRTGKRIKERIDESIQALQRTGHIGSTADQRLQLAEPARAASG